MRAWSVLNELAIAALVGRWTVLLALAWFGHWALARRNPRWRVALWRATVVGIMGVGLLMLVPPLLTIPIVPTAKPVVVSSNVTSSTPRPQEPGLGRSAAISRQQDSGLPATTAPTSPGQPAAEAWRVVPWLLGLWGVGVAVLAVRIALAWFGLNRIISRAQEAPAQVVEECRDVAESIGSPAVRVVCSTEIATPCLAGIRRPVLLLPARELANDDLRSVLAHELAHARGHDLAWNLVAHFATIALWFHPLAWRLRSAHAAACDGVCDAVAADFLGDVPTYARTLARLALAALEPPPASALAMARSSDIRRRVNALSRKVFRAPLPRSLTLPAILGGAMLLFLIGSLAVTDAKPPEDTRPAPKASTVKAGEGSSTIPTADGRLEIQAVDATTGKPLDGAAVVWQLRINNGRYQRKTNSTDLDGRAVLEWPKGATVNGLTVTARKTGFVPYVIRWDDNTHPLRFPSVKVLRFVPGITIGGVVNDEAGKPVVAARIKVNGPPTESEESYYSTDLAEALTDALGRWRVNVVPSDLNLVSVNVQAPGFTSVGVRASRDLGAMIILKRGFTIKGRVIGPQSQPVVGATIRGGDKWRQEPKPTKTDALGAFVLENCPPGASLVTVQSESFAPDLQEIHPEDQPTLEFRLVPGHTLRGKVVDKQGKPVAGVMVAADGWRNHQSLDFRVDTDKNGRFVWQGAPDDVVLYSIGKAGYMSRRNFALTHSDAEQVVTLDPELVISGHVTDAATKRPIPTFRVMRGLVFSNNPRVLWRAEEAAEFTDGRYTVKHSETYTGYAVRIEAAGYKPAESRVFEANEGATSFDVSLSHAEASDLLTGVVLRPDGRPANGAEVALATFDHPLFFETEHRQFSRRNGMSFAKTDADGRFSFDHPKRPYLLAASSDDGYAEATPKKFANSGRLALEPWGKIKGEARIGRQPATHQVITFYRRDYQPAPGEVYAFYNVETQTDAEGRFVFDRVIPGASEVARVVVTELGNGSQQHMACWQEPVDVAPGQTVQVRIGGKGRPVVGRVTLQAPPYVRVDWRQNRPATIEKARGFNPLQGLFGPDLHQNDRFAANLDKDGRFRVEDVPPGHYELTVTVDAPPVRDQPGPAKELGRVKVNVDVPKGNDGKPVDLGQIVAHIAGQ